MRVRRAVAVFSSVDFSIQSHPQPVSCPARASQVKSGRSRQLPLYITFASQKSGLQSALCQPCDKRRVISEGSPSTIRRLQRAGQTSVKSTGPRTLDGSRPSRRASNSNPASPVLHGGSSSFDREICFAGRFTRRLRLCTPDSNATSPQSPLRIRSNTPS